MSIVKFQGMSDVYVLMDEVESINAKASSIKLYMKSGNIVDILANQDGKRIVEEIIRGAYGELRSLAVNENVKVTYGGDDD